MLKQRITRVTRAVIPSGQHPLVDLRCTHFVSPYTARTRARTQLKTQALRRSCLCRQRSRRAPPGYTLALRIGTNRPATYRYHAGLHKQTNPTELAPPRSRGRRSVIPPTPSPQLHQHNSITAKPERRTIPRRTCSRSSGHLQVTQTHGSAGRFQIVSEILSEKIRPRPVVSTTV